MQRPGCRIIALSMGKLRHRRSRRDHALSSQHLVGRAPRCALQLDSPMASGHHAELRWKDGSWELHDLDSRNGTFLDNEALGKGERHKVAMGSLIAFGDPEDVYELVDDSAPGAWARSQAGERQYSQSGTLLLPDPDRPQCFVWQEGSRWFVEGDNGEFAPAKNGQTLHVGDSQWVLDLPIEVEPTVQLGAVMLATAILRFKVSRNEEHVELEVVHAAKTLQLPARAYWYTVLTLARARIRDRERPELSAAEQGWLYVDDLVAQQLQIEPTLLYQHICRAKRSLAREGVIDYASLVERRPTSREIRLGVSDIEIVAL